MDTQYIYQKTSGGVISPLFTVGNAIICSSTVATLEDCNITAPAANHTLVYDSATSKFINKQLVFATDLSDVEITSPDNSNKLMFNASNKWFNTTPYYYTVNIYGKLKDSVVNTNAIVNLLDSANYDSYTESVNSNGLSKNGSNQITGIRNASYPMKIDMDITLAITSITDSSVLKLAFNNSTTELHTMSNMNLLNNPSKTLNLSQLTTLPIATNYYPSLTLLGSAVYAGYASGDISFSFGLYEV